MLHKMTNDVKSRELSNLKKVINDAWNWQMESKLLFQRKFLGYSEIFKYPSLWDTLPQASTTYGLLAKWKLFI